MAKKAPKEEEGEPQVETALPKEEPELVLDAEDSEDTEAEDEEDEGERGRFARFTRRLLDRDDGKKVLSAMWETSDRAKTEAVRMMAREVRSYLDALEIKEDLLHLVRSHSLEVTASLRLKPLPPEPKGADDDESR